MAVTLSRNLKLRIDSNLTANAKYNLERIDDLGTTFLVDSTESLNIRSISDITIEPQSADIGGSGIGGTVSIGTANHTLDSISIYAAEVNFSAGLGLLDQGTGGTRYLHLRYKSDIAGSTDTSADRTLSLDLDGSDRNLVLGGDVVTSGGSLTLALSGSTSLILPLTGTLSTLAGTELFTNKTLDMVRFTVSGNMTTIRAADAGQSGNLNFQLPSDAGVSGQVLSTDGVGNLAWITAGGGGGSEVTGYTTTWLNADGATKAVTHNLGSTALDVSLIDLDDNTLIEVDSIVITSGNAISLSASEAPNSAWKIVIQAS